MLPSHIKITGISPTAVIAFPQRLLHRTTLPYTLPPAALVCSAPSKPPPLADTSTQNNKSTTPGRETDEMASARRCRSAFDRGNIPRRQAFMKNRISATAAAPTA
jgi:hypothetical protein